jgi:Tfp pilus assembly protein PilP
MIGFAFVLSFLMENVWAAEMNQIPAPAPTSTAAVQSTTPTDSNVDQARLKLKLRDPFRMPDKVISEATEIKTDLEMFALNELKLVGILAGKGFSRGMVLAPDKKTYIVTPTMKIGTNGGVIQKITANRLVIQEKKTNLANEIDLFEKELRLTTDGAPAPSTTSQPKGDHAPKGPAVMQESLSSEQSGSSVPPSVSGLSSAISGGIIPGAGNQGAVSPASMNPGMVNQ